MDLEGVLKILLLKLDDWKEENFLKEGWWGWVRKKAYFGGNSLFQVNLIILRPQNFITRVGTYWGHLKPKFQIPQGDQGIKNF